VCDPRGVRREPLPDRDVGLSVTEIAFPDAHIRIAGVLVVKNDEHPGTTVQSTLPLYRMKLRGFHVAETRESPHVFHNGVHHHTICWKTPIAPTHAAFDGACMLLERRPRSFVRP